jgi:hypothetical protein
MRPVQVFNSYGIRLLGVRGTAGKPRRQCEAARAEERGKGVGKVGSGVCWVLKRKKCGLAMRFVVSILELMQ